MFRCFGGFFLLFLSFQVFATCADQWSDVEKLRRLEIKPNEKVLIVLDGLSSGRDYVDVARVMFGSQVRFIHVKTRSYVGDGLFASFDSDGYEADVMWSSSIDNELGRLLQFPNVHLVAGSDTSTKTWADINHRWGRPIVAHIDAIANKFEANKLLESNVRTIPGQYFTSAETALEYMRTHQLSFPRVVKPNVSAGSYGVRVIETEQQLRDDVALFLGSSDPIGNVCTGFLLQDFFDPRDYQEYVIDAVVDSEYGVVVTDLLQYRKEVKDRRFIYLRTTYLSQFKEHPYFNRFQSFASELAHQYAMTTGVLHIEVFVKKDTTHAHPELVFIEAGHRPAGGGIPKLIRSAQGFDQITMHLLSLFDRKTFAKAVGEFPVAPHDAMQLELLGPESPMRITSVPSEEEIQERIPDLLEAHLKFAEDKTLGPTTDLFDYPGYLDVQGPDLDRAEKIFRKWERQDFYRGIPVSEK